MRSSVKFFWEWAQSFSRDVSSQDLAHRTFKGRVMREQLLQVDERLLVWGGCHSSGTLVLHRMLIAEIKKKKISYGKISESDIWGKTAGCKCAQLGAWPVDISNCSVSSQADSSTHFSVLDPWVTGWNNSKKKQGIHYSSILYDSGDHHLILLMALPLASEEMPSSRRESKQRWKWFLLVWIRPLNLKLHFEWFGPNIKNKQTKTNKR